MNSGSINAGDRMSVLSFGRAEPDETSLRLPEDLSLAEWEEIGGTLGRAERNVMWWVGDWWMFGHHRFAEGKAIISAPDWGGPAYQTCKNAAVVCRNFATRSRRRYLVPFSHHVEVAALQSEQADAVLDKAEAYGWSVREVRTEVHKLKNAAAVGAYAPSDRTCTTDDLVALLAGGRKFGCVYADPPWLYDNQGTRAATGNHYSGLSVGELCALPIRDLAAADAHLHLWVVNAFRRESFDILDAWGFEWRSEFVWCKPEMGIGNYWRNSHEVLVTAIRGNAKRFNDHSMKSWDVFPRGAHSAKPEQVRGMVERASRGPYLELFGRRQVPGWTVFGNQIARDLFFTPPERESDANGAGAVDAQAGLFAEDQDEAA